MSKHVEDLLKNSSHFCILPWIHFHAWPNGKVMPCCVADSNISVSQITPGESILNMMNSEQYKQMRIDMYNDVPVEACRRCYDIEKIGTWTLRQSHNSRCTEDSINLVDNTNEDGSIDQFKMKYMDIRFSNICNMKCRTCGPECSSLHAQEFIEKRKGADALMNYFKMESAVVNINETGEFLKKLKPHLNEVEEVYFAGGEALITQEHYECLEYWIKNDLTDQVELTYTTNFSSLKFKNKNLINLWKKFPKLKIWASLDAEGDQAELLRKGTDWNKIEGNIRKLRKEVPHAEFSITPTISIWNVYSFPKFFDKLIEENLIDETVSPRFNLLTNPWWANILILPEFSKLELIDYYRKYINKYEYNVHIKNGFKLIQNNIKNGSYRYGDQKSYENKGGILQFIEFNEEMDLIRNENILQTMPELTEIYKWARS